MLFRKVFCGNNSFCKYLVIPTEKEIPNAVETMLSVSNLVIVTEESVSMISEALRGHAPVIGLSVGSNGTSGKKERFRDQLEREKLVTFSRVGELDQKMDVVWNTSAPSSFQEVENRRIQERLRQLL